MIGSLEVRLIMKIFVELMNSALKNKKGWANFKHRFARIRSHFIIL